MKMAGNRKSQQQILQLQQAAFEALDDHPDGAVGFFKKMSKEEPVAFMRFLGQYIPKTSDPDEVKQTGVTINVMHFGDKPIPLGLPESPKSLFGETIDVLES
jgi:hypothetical protein